jgi:hypothetical protein
MNIKLLFKKTQAQILKTSTVVAIVLLLSWGITQATSSEFEQATKNFSVIGTVSSITEDTISLIDARGSDTKEEELYNLNIENVKTVETKDYNPLIISDVVVGSTIIAQGVTNNSTFFITRIVLFSDVALEEQVEILPETATSTTATSTEEVIEEETATSTDSVVQEDVATSTDSETFASSTIPSATSSQPISTTTEEETATSTDSTVIDTVIDVIEEVIDTVVDVIDDIINPPPVIDETDESDTSNEEVEEATVEPTPIVETETEQEPIQEQIIEEEPVQQESQSEEPVINTE